MSNTCKESGSLECNCTGTHLEIQVLCVYMIHLETVSIRYCAKRPIAEQLVQHALFPCAPLRPSLAIDIFMLEWATTLFLHMALNVHTWTTATEIMLKCEGYAFNASDSLCCHFNNALVHYQILIQLVDAEVAQMVNAVPPPQMHHTETPTPPASFSHNQYCDSSTEHAPSLLPIMLDQSTLT